jgi:cytochrome b subunit of formate dehydrogenase
MLTGLCPILGIEFDWVQIHWIAGVLLTAVIIFHIFRAILKYNPLAIWIGPLEMYRFLMALRQGRVLKPGKYSIAQRLMHNATTVFCLIAIVTGALLLLRIDTPLWERDPYILSQSAWGLIYVLHGLAALVFVTIILVHIYFSIRPEKLFYLRSMVLGWITKDELLESHDPTLWKFDNENENE